MKKPKRLRGISKIFTSNHSFSKSIELALDPNAVIIHWPSKGGARNNFGDKLNPYLVSKITNRKIYNAPEIYNFLLREEYKVIGSSLGGKVDERVTIWGTGFISNKRKPIAQPKKICAVRGPLSRKKFLDNGFSCPDIYGDPALLLPRYLKVSNEKKYPLGFIAQWRDQNVPIVKEINKLENVKIIDITDPIEDFVRKVNECEKIITSTLHALITCDAYQIPCLWLRVSEEPLGDLFKFQDYYASIGIDNMKPNKISNIGEFNELEKLCRTHDLNIDLDKLLNNCPFL